MKDAQVDRLEEWAELLKAVAHPVRLVILARLLDGPKCVDHIRELVDVRQSNASQHLAILRQCGLVACYQDGARRCYYLTRPSLAKALFAFLERDYPEVRPTRRAAVRAARQSLAARAREATPGEQRMAKPDGAPG